tara:strand:+ start:489 stop:1760 length:1272 start_codon:yes stop_codon:yes gene_type:complete
MKKIMIIFLALFLFPIISAVEIDMKDSFSQGETLTAKVSGNFFKAISEQDVVFYRGHVRTSIVAFVTKINNDFYIYANLIDKSPNNYSIAIENAEYFEGSQIVEEDIVKNFSINENVADFSVDKGFVITEEDFFIEVLNLQDMEIAIDLGSVNYNTRGGFFGSLLGEKKTSGNLLILNPGDSKKINFDVDDFEELSVIGLSTENLNYEILVYVFSKQEKEKEKNFRFEPSMLNISMATDSETSRIIYLNNTGGTEIENISLEISDELLPYISLLTNEIGELDLNLNKKIELRILSGSEKKLIQGQIIARTYENELVVRASVFLNFIKDYIPSGEDDDFVEAQTCEELEGAICSSDQKCSGEIEYLNEGICCIGSCKNVEESSAGKIIGWLMLLIFVVFIIWFYLKKYKKVEGIDDLMRILKRN